MKERSNQEDTAHFEDQEHPADAKADEGAQNEVDHPQQTELRDCYNKGRWVSKSLEAKEGSTLKVLTLKNR